jgi:acyl-CoA synthetase (NDP forming)
LSQGTQNELKKFIPLAGNSLKNPLDTTLAFRDISLLTHEVETVAADPEIDMLIIMPHIDMALRVGADRVDKMISYLCDFAKNSPFGKPAVIVFHSFANDPTEIELRFKLKVELTNKGIAVYSTLAGASRALAKLHEHSRIQNSMGR